MTGDILTLAIAFFIFCAGISLLIYVCNLPYTSRTPRR